MVSLTQTREPVGNGRAKTRDYGKAFATFGVALNPVGGGDEAIAEACPWCGGAKLYVNTATGLFHCKSGSCGVSGNVTDFLTRVHGEALAATADDDYRALKAKRGIGLQALKRHGLAFHRGLGHWLIPFKDRTGSVVNIQRYDLHTGNKHNLPGLPTSLFGLDTLGADPKKTVFLCEGPFDAIALDYHLGDKRGKYDVVAQPGPFKKEWVEHFRGRKVRCLFDNDAGGEGHRKRAKVLLGESGIVNELLLLKWPERVDVNGEAEAIPEGCDLNDLVRDPRFEGLSIVKLSHDHGVKVVAEPKLAITHGRRPQMEEVPIDWVWPDHLRCGTYISFSGKQGTLKSTIALELAARYTTGEKMPLCGQLGLPAGHVLYLHAEDDREAVEKAFEWAGGNFDHWHSMPAIGRDGDPVNVLDSLKEIEGVIREYGIRLMVIDGQNSVVGAPCIATDMQARSNVSNKLHQYAQRLNLCLIGIRNEDAEGRALGPQSFGDIGRCVLRAVDKGSIGPDRCCELLFVKVSDVAPSKYPPIDYSVQDLGGSHRKILWGVNPARRAVAKLGAGLKGKGGEP